MSLPYLQPYLGLSNGLNTLHAAGGPGGAVGGWVELARTTLGGASSTINVSSLADKRYYMVLADTARDAAATNNAMRMGNGSYDSGSNYADRYSSDGSADSTTTSQTSMFGQLIGHNSPLFSVGYIANRSSNEKLWINHVVNQNTAGAGTAPLRREICSKHAFTSNPIDQLQFNTLNANTFNSGSEIVVLGYDPADTHTNNFWQELASVELTSANDIIDSGTFTAKKYLWIQIYNPVKPSGGNSYVYFNNVYTGGQHSGRSNTNGANPTNQSSLSDYQLTSSNGSIINHDVSGSGTVTGLFTNMFVTNTANKEKLSIIHSVSGWTNTGSGVAPARFECVNKWTNTSDQITSVQCGAKNTSNYMGSGSILKVWGAD